MILVILYRKITVFLKRATPISVIISEKPQTASGDMFLNMLTFIPESMLKLQGISIKEHSRLHLVNSYDLFLVCWSKTNCTPAKSWTPNGILNRTGFRLLKKFYRGFIKVPLFSKKHSEIFCKKVLTYHQNALM
mgnify:CR=1 FL=1